MERTDGPSLRASEERRVSISAPWTTTRCQRLLRPLLASIKSLHKQTSAIPSTTALSQPRQSSMLLAAEERKLRQRTYARCKKQLRQDRATPPCEQDDDLPRTRHRKERPRPPAKCHYICGQTRPTDPIGGLLDKCFFEREMRHLRSSAGSELYTIYESIMRDLDAVLRATTEETTRPEPRASLLAMCLRKVPESIAHQEAFEEQEAEANRSKTMLDGANVSASFYSYIESRFSVREDGGCSYLRSIVRAHALWLVSQLARTAGSLHVGLCCVVVSLCRAYRLPLREVEGLVAAMVDAPMAAPDDISSEVLRLAPLRPLLMSSYSSPSFKALHYRLLSRALLSGNLPLDWLWTPGFSTILKDPPTLFADGETLGASMDLMANAITLISNHKSTDGPERPPERSRRSIRTQTAPADIGFSLLVSLAASVAHQCITEPFSPSRLADTRKRVSQVIDASLCEVQRGHKHIRKQFMAYLLALTGRLSSHHWTFEESECADMQEEACHDRWEAIIRKTWSEMCRGNDGSRRSIFYDKTKMLVCELAVRRGCLEYFSRMEHLMYYCDQIDQLRIPALEQLRFDAALALAERTKKFADRSFAEGLTRDDGGVSLLNWRWDEGISEWVSKTPATDPIAAHRQREEMESEPPSPSPAPDRGLARRVGRPKRKSDDVDELVDELENDLLMHNSLGFARAKRIRRLGTMTSRPSLRCIMNSGTSGSSDDELGL